jgi:hypothetical protein
LGVGRDKREREESGKQSTHIFKDQLPGDFEKVRLAGSPDLDSGPEGILSEICW